MRRLVLQPGTLATGSLTAREVGNGSGRGDRGRNRGLSPCPSLRTGRAVFPHPALRSVGLWASIGRFGTVMEIKEAVCKLPARKKRALARWLQAQVDDRLTDADMMAIAAAGAQALEKREAACAKRKAR